LVAGTCYGQVRTLYNEFDKFLDEAGPSTPVRISGMNILNLLEIFGLGF